LMTHGPHGWSEKISVLQMRTTWLCKKLDELGVTYFREPSMNLVTIRAAHISDALAEKYTLVPQSHDEDNQWYKIVIMHHVEMEAMTAFLADLKAENEKVLTS